MRRGIGTFSVYGVMMTVGLVGFILMGSLAACDGSRSHTSSPQVLHVAWLSGGGSLDITTLDPDEGSDTSSIPIINQVFDGLVTLNSQMQVVNWGADKVTPSADGLTYVFHIRPGQKFSDGMPVKASDYAYSMNRSENPCVASPVNYYLFALVDAAQFAGEACDSQTGALSIENGKGGRVITTLIGDSIIPDDAAGTLTLKLAAPAGYFLDAMTYSTSYALEQSVITGANEGADEKWQNNLLHGSTGQGGSGMFYVSKWDHQGTLTLKANPYWWGRAAGMTPKLTAVDYKIFVGTDTEYAAYANDKTYDVEEDIPPLQLASVRQQRDFHRGPYLGYEGVAMNFKIPPFDNVDARAAFCLALNKDQLNDTLFKGANIPTWHLVPEGMPGFNPNLQPLDGAPTSGNQVLARREWQKYLTTLHGAPAPPIQFTYFPGSPTLTAFANTMITSWKQVLGVTVALDPLYPHLKDEAAKPRQLSRWARIVDYPDPQDFLSLIYATSSSYNWNNSGSPAIDRLMNQADHSMDNSARFPLYNQAEQMLVDDVSDCPLVQLALNYRVRVSVHGYVLDPEGDVATPDWPRVAITA